MTFDDYKRLDSAIQAQVRIEQKCDLILQKLEHMSMTLSQDIKDLSKKIDDATNVIAGELTDLKGQVHNSMSDTEVTEVKAALQANIDKLTGLGANPENPVP